jgi:hypothetical protein
VKCEDCEGTGEAANGKPCFICDGHGELCDVCGESPEACECDEDDPEDPDEEDK